ncbi:MAG: site-2 protease family protein [Pirellulaceae bacterium]|nr:site-2 protease family protein [Pirellulaceae bacterium]
MFRSVKLGSIGGIGVYIHWTFWMLMGIYAISATASGGLAAGLEAAAFIGAVFACVLAHEFGHAAAAAHYGIKTTDITLMIVGGMARLARIPERPIQEFVIAVAGPAVNVLIGSILFAALALGSLVPEPSGLFAAAMSFGQNLLIANIVLVLFNMLPAFPMDGGRVLRSLLAMQQGQLRATETAARVGRWMALLFVLAALFMGEFSLLLVAGFVYFAGSAELMQMRLKMMNTPHAGATMDVPFATFRYTTSQPYASPFEPRTVRNEDVVDAVEVRVIRD